MTKQSGLIRHSCFDILSLLGISSFVISPIVLQGTRESLMLLLSIILLPLLAAGALALLGGDRSVARWAALLTAIGTLLLSLGIVSRVHTLSESHVHADHDTRANGPIDPKLEWRHTWLRLGNISHEQILVTDQDGEALKSETVELPVRLEFYLGADGISVLMLVLTALLTVSAVLISWESIESRATEFYICLLVLEAGMLGAFCAFDLVLFYVFFEFTLIPLFFLVGIWGGVQRQYAAYRFFIYTLAGSVVTLVGLVALVVKVMQDGLTTTPFSIPDIAAALQKNPLPDNWQIGLLLALSAGFCIKVPLFPFHTWLPLAHTEAPTAGSVLLAGILLKLGTYGFLRICLPLLPDAVSHLGVPVVATLSVIGIIYGALGALAQSDIKKLVAYSSVSHLGFCMLGMFALNSEGITGSVLQMVNHGLSTGALFLLVGMVYDRYHTRELSELGGLAARLPLLSVCMVFICLSSIGLPGLNGFVGELLALIGMFKANPMYSALGATGVILGAWYLLDMLRRAFFGPLKEPASVHGPIFDINGRELLSVAPLMMLCLWIGVYPKPVLDTIEEDVRAVVKLYPQKDVAPKNDVAKMKNDE
jgi:NADH-quinone oxidoreductase subunit M